MDPKRLRPLKDHLIVQTLEPEKRKSGIIVPEKFKEERNRAKVVSVGPGRRYDGKVVPMDVKPGDIVLFKPAHGWDGPFKEGDYLFLEEDDIMAVIYEHS